MKVLALALTATFAVVRAADCDTTTLASVLADPNLTQCGTDSGYDFTTGVQPTETEAKAMCTSTACQSVLTTVLALNPTECTIPVGGRISLLEDLFYYVTNICGIDTTASTSTAPSTAPSATPSASTSGLSSGIGGGSISIAFIIVNVIFLILGIALTSLHYRHQRYRNNFTSNTDTIETSTPYTSHTAQSPSSSANSKANKQEHDNTGSLWNDPELLALQMSAEHIQDIMKIGNGAYGVVWLVKYRNTQLLASKRIQKDRVTRERTQGFVDEIKLVAKFDHPNIVKLIGVAWTMESDLQALFEYMKNGDLHEYLVEASTPREWNREKIQIAIDVAEALVYIHSFQSPLVHRDLKSRNVLLSEDMRGKLTDFGVSQFRSVDNTMVAGVGTSRWLAPEVISGSNDYGQAVDIYSFGVLLSELDTHRVPYADAQGANGNTLPDAVILQMVAAGSLRPTFRSSCLPEILSLANRCLAHRPEDRPTAPQVAYTMRTVQRTLF